MALPSKLFAGLLGLTLLVLPASTRAESKNPADYPLRLHIFSRAEHTHYHRGIQDFATGEGRGNLYANGEVHGVDFSFECGQRVERSAGYETYLAKWKKPNKQLVILLPIFGKTGTYEPCDFNADVKDIAYYIHGGEVLTESPDAFKAWMVKHNYDPEHGKNEPEKLNPADAPPPPPAQ